MRTDRILPFLRAFDAVARLGYVRSAAVELNLTPGAISHQIKTLEQNLGVDLFVRDRRRLALSVHGQAFQHTAAKMLRELERGLEAISPLREADPQKTLAISAASGFAHIWLAPRLLDIADQIGLPSFESQIAREMNQIDWRKTDIAVVYDNPPWPGYFWEPLPNLSLSPLCSPALLHALPLKHPRDIRQHRLLHEDSGGEWQRWLNAAKITEPAPRNAYFNRLTMAFNAAVTGHGVALVSDFLASQYLRSGQLVRAFDISIPAAKRYYVVVVESRRHEPLIARTMELLLALERG
ncbi:LysR substrate-binding domain-containing protein [Algihabitans albus]|uniref:LysR substrate-binding domain-containing protein n=1 Tax=Algihabitans albus TaxID=2164067 RepID=UPI000E5CBD1F|nr:LysR substrate-binding domain-containing protein [Algihabitans albus]